MGPCNGHPSSVPSDKNREGRSLNTRPVKNKKPIPFDFVLELLDPLAPYTRPMFGCTSVYIEDKIVLILRRKATAPQDNGVWLATTCDHHTSLRKEFPNLRSISVLGHGVTAWQILPEDAGD